eukprot:sb/3477714/
MNHMYNCIHTHTHTHPVNKPCQPCQTVSNRVTQPHTQKHTIPCSLYHVIICGTYVIHNLGNSCLRTGQREKGRLGGQLAGGGGVGNEVTPLLRALQSKALLSVPAM